MRCKPEQFQFEMLRISNHTACRFAEKTRFSAHFGPGGAVLPPCVPLFSKAKRSEREYLLFLLNLLGFHLHYVFFSLSGMNSVFSALRGQRALWKERMFRASALEAIYSNEAPHGKR